MSVNSYLTELASSLVLTPSEKDSISKSVDTIKTRLSLYFSTEIEEKKRYSALTFEEQFFQEKMMRILMLMSWWCLRIHTHISRKHS